MEEHARDGEHDEGNTSFVAEVTPAEDSEMLEGMFTQ